MAWLDSVTLSGPHRSTGTRVATALAGSLGACSALWLSAAHAQGVIGDAASVGQPPDIRIDVTGSNIKRIEGEGALPVTIITREEIERSGATTPSELLQHVSANNSLGALNVENSIGAVTFSAQTASLRGLGGGRTLVLIDGHRIDTFAGEIQGVQGVNLSAIPFAAIERVEILRDGASAIYGSDAIGGVINFITRSDYAGGEVTTFYGSPTRAGGGDQWLGTVSAGFGDLAKDRWNAFVSLSYNEQKPLDQADRTYSRSSYLPGLGLIGVSSNTYPGNITTGGIGVVTDRNGAPRVASSPAECAPNVFIDDDILGSGCWFDAAAVHGVNLIPHQKTWNVFGEGRRQINGDWQAYLQGMYSRDEVRLSIQPGPVSSAIFYGSAEHWLPATITLQPASPFYPHAIAAAAGVDGEPLDIHYRTFDNGFRDTTDTNENWELVGGVRGAWQKWDVDVSAFFAEGTTRERLNGGFQDYRALLPILNSGIVNFFGPNTADVVALERSADFVGDVFHGTSTNYGALAKLSGDLYALPAGPLALAVGVQARKEGFEQNSAEALENGTITGFGGSIKSTPNKSRSQWATFAEVDIPIVRTLEANAAVRSDHYSDVGNTTNPKFSLRWQPTRSTLVRASYGTGFLAPSLYQLYTPDVTGLSQPGLSDPIRCPVTNDTALDCYTQFNVLFGGNASLKPEVAENFTAGFVVEPIADASFSVDWFKIGLYDSIVNGIPPPTILGDLARYGDLVTRAPPDPNFPGLPGRITLIDQRYQNPGTLHLQGVDADVHYRSPMQSWGRLSFDLSGTYYIRYDVQNRDGSYTGTVGTAFNSVGTGVMPRWKHYASLSWDRGPWSATLAQTYQTSYTDQQSNLEGRLITVASLSLWDLQGAYTGIARWKLVLGVKNLFDRDPPKSNQFGTFIAGSDPSYYDPRARFVYAKVAYTFK